MRMSVVLSLLLLSGVVVAKPARDPAQARFITEDIPRFWQAWDEAGGPPDAATLQRLYLEPGSPGLTDFTRLRIQDAERLARTVAAAPDYYRALRPASLAIDAQLPAMRAAFARLEAAYPAAVFPDVYFLIGRMNSGGTTSERALLIGIEMFGRGPGVSLDGLSDWHQAVIGRSSDLPNIVAHELVHYQQAPESRQPNLLEASVREGMADYLAERIAGAHINAAAHVWGLANECALWREFEPRMRTTDYSGFLYDGGKVQDRPADLGYFIGYRIVAAYLDRARDRRAAYRDALGHLPVDELLARSGYAPCAGQ
jgi:hypothetical protein